MNSGEDELSNSHGIGEKLINCVDNRKIFLKPTRKQLAYRIFHTTCELNLPFYVNYYFIHTRSKIGYIICQLKIYYPNEIKECHSYNNETCNLYNTREYSSNITSTPSLGETEDRTTHIIIGTLADLERFMFVHLNQPQKIHIFNLVVMY